MIFSFFRFLFEIDSPMYMTYRRRVESLRKGVIAESTSRREDAKATAAEEAKPGGGSRRKSRWGDENEKVTVPNPTLGMMPTTSSMMMMMPIPNNMRTRNNPQLIQYAIKVFGTTDLEESQWKQCEDQMKVRNSQLFFFFFNKIKVMATSEFCRHPTANFCRFRLRNWLKSSLTGFIVIWGRLLSGQLFGLKADIGNIIYFLI
jgi:hypothetical protein